MINKNLKKIFILMLCFGVGVSLCSCNDEKKEKIKVAEVAHSVFYAPQYVAIELGYFEEVGLDVELINANGADKVTASLLSKDVQIGLQGPEPTIYLNENLLRQKYESKSWTTPAKLLDDTYAEALPEDQFQSFEEYVTFVLEHEAAHRLRRRH
jgi:hypothetical protein